MYSTCMVFMVTTYLLTPLYSTNQSKSLILDAMNTETAYHPCHTWYTISYVHRRYFGSRNFGTMGVELGYISVCMLYVATN